MLKHRLIFGSLMIIGFIVLVILDSRIDGSLNACVENRPVQGTIFCLFLVLLAVPAQFELGKLIQAKNFKIFYPISITATILFATTWYWTQLFQISTVSYLATLSAFTLFALFLYQYIHYGTSGVIANCGVNYFSIIYLGLLSAFCLAIRIEFGPWQLLMFLFVVKSADIGAYTIGRLFGKHKFSPNISPGKTWEGMAGGAAVAILVAVLFAEKFDIMPVLPAVCVGLGFAFIGQLGDLAESMIKRDAQQKDSANSVPGFGGILDVIDSPLVVAPVAYWVFTACSK